MIIVNNEVEVKEMLLLALFSKNYGWYMNLVHIHSTRKPTIPFVKNSGNIFHWQKIGNKLFVDYRHLNA